MTPVDLLWQLFNLTTHTKPLRSCGVATGMLLSITSW